MQLDIDVGGPGAAVRPVQEAFEQAGVKISEGTITALRSGKRDPAWWAYKLTCAERLRDNHAALKTDCCLRVAEVGCKLRQPNNWEPRLYACYGLTRAMATALGFTERQLRYVLKVMRADVALASRFPWNRDVVRKFQAVASLFLRVHRHKHWRTWERHVAEVVREAWDGWTVHGFYQAMNAINTGPTRAAWVPYEVEAFLSFYGWQLELGSPLTMLDRDVLAGAVNHRPTARQLCPTVESHTGVAYDADCIAVHRHLLVTGSPQKVLRI